MKKNMLAAALLALLGASRAFAASPVTMATAPRVPQPLTAVMNTASSTSTVIGLSISSAPATSVIVDTTQSFRQACVQNMDTSAALYCGDNVSVSSLTANALMGVVIPPAADATHPAQPTCFSVVAGMDWYCRSGSVTASTRAVIVRAR